MAVRWLIGLLLGLAACPVAAAWAESAARITGPIRGGAHGFPFASTVLDLAAAGYVEEEFFVEGSASGYASDGELAPNGSWTVKVASHSPYKTRILVRRPADPSRFNGTLVVEWLNVSGGGDNPADWAFVHPLLLARGYAWVGVSAQSVGVVGFPPEHPRSALGKAGALKTWDAERYGSLLHPGDTYSYDIFAQVGRALRAAGDVDPLGGLHVVRVLAMGVSQSAARLATYINAVQALAKVYDGFLVHSRGGQGAPLSEAPQAAIPAPAAMRSRTDLDTPVLTFETETDVALLGYYPARQPDSDAFRLWEVAGTAHTDTYQIRVSRADANKSLKREGGLDCELPGNSGPQRYVLRAALDHLDRWVREGKPAPHAPRLSVVPGAPDRILRDGRGNALGGIRTPPLDVPTVTLSGEGNRGGMFCQLFGVTTPFDEATLETLYPSRDAYLAAFEQALDDARRAGFLLDDDLRELRDEAARNGAQLARDGAGEQATSATRRTP